MACDKFINNFKKGIDIKQYVKKISLGNFNNLAKQYKNSRPGYSDKITKLLKLILLENKTIYSLDLGSGTEFFLKII